MAEIVIRVRLEPRLEAIAGDLPPPRRAPPDDASVLPLGEAAMDFSRRAGTPAAARAAAPSLTRSATFRPSNTGLTEGDWRLYAIVQDATGRKREVQTTAGGGGSPVLLRLRTAPGADTACIAPVATPDGRAVLGFPLSVTLTTSTDGATIEYQIRNLGELVLGSWTTYDAPITIPGNRTLHSGALKAGLMESPVVQEDYWREEGNSPPPGWSIL